MIYISSRSFLNIDEPARIAETVEGKAYLQWMDLDRALVRLWGPGLHGVHTKAMVCAGKEEQVCESLRLESGAAGDGKGRDNRTGGVSGFELIHFPGGSVACPSFVSPRSTRLRLDHTLPAR